MFIDLVHFRNLGQNSDITISQKTNTIDMNPSGSYDILPIVKVDFTIQLEHGYFPLPFLVISLISISKYQLHCYI
jgi:hypothetical protein